MGAAGVPTPSPGQGSHGYNEQRLRPGVEKGGGGSRESGRAGGGGGQRKEGWRYLQGYK